MKSDLIEVVVAAAAFAAVHTWGVVQCCHIIDDDDDDKGQGIKWRGFDLLYVFSVHPPVRPFDMWHTVFPAPSR